MARELVVTVRVENRAALRALRQLDGVMVSGARTAARSTSAFTGMARGIGMISGGLLGAQGAIAAFRFAKNAAIGMNASLEQSTLQFQTLMGDARLAEQHVKSLFEFAKRTPFETGPIIEGSKQLQNFGGVALNNIETIRILGDASAATGADFERLSFWTGRLFSKLQSGEGFGEAALNLQELAVLTPEARKRMKELADAGASATDIFDAFTESLQSHAGAMELQAETWAGLTSTFFEGLQLMIAGSAESAGAFDFLKDVLKEANSAMEVMTATGVSKLQIELEQLEQAEAKYIDRLRERVEAGSALQFQEEQRLERIQKDIVATKAQIAQLDIQRQGEEAFAFAKRQRALAADAVVQAEVAETQAATEAATAAAKLAEEQEQVNAEWRESIQAVTVLTTAYHGYNQEHATFLGLAPTVTQNIDAFNDSLQGLWTEGVLPATGGFIELDGALNSGVNPTVQGSIGLMDSFRGSLVQVWDQAVASTGGILDAFTSLFSGGGGGLSGIVSGGLSMLVDLFSGGMFSLGGLVARGLNAIGGMFRRLFGGPSAEELAGREIVENFQKNSLAILNETQAIEAGGELWRATNIRVRDSYLEVGLSERQALDDVQALYDAIKQGPEATNAALNVIINNMNRIETAASNAASAMDAAFRQRSAPSLPSALTAPRPSGPPPVPVPFQHGGIVTRPTVALVGEAGPEAIVPLGRRGEMGLTVNLDLRGSVVSTSAAVRDLSDRVSATILRQLQTRRRLNPA